MTARCGDVLQVLTETREGAGRVRRIVGELRSFGRPDDEGVAPFEVTRVVESAVGIAWNEVRHRARLVKEYGACPSVLGSPARLGQVVLNVLVNAAQAIPEGHAESNTVALRTYAEAGAVCIEISDTGVGIAKENVARVFEPFFTTKPVGHGTGLGLAICRNLMRAMGGEIEVSSELGVGSTFRQRDRVPRELRTNSALVVLRHCLVTSTRGVESGQDRW